MQYKEVNYRHKGPSALALTLHLKLQVAEIIISRQAKAYVTRPFHLRYLQLIQSIDLCWNYRAKFDQSFRVEPQNLCQVLWELTLLLKFLKNPYPHLYNFKE